MTSLERASAPAGGDDARRSRSAGSSLAELLVALGLATAVSTMAVPPLLAGLDTYRAGHAARYVAGRIRDTRGRAIAAGRSVGMQFSGQSGVPSWATYADGNRNGVRTADVVRGIDSPVVPPARLADVAQGVLFCLRPGTPDLDGGSTGGNGLRLGSGNWLSFSPSGSSSSGTIYLAGPGRHQYAVRVLGSTGRIRIMRYDESMRMWVSP